MKHQKNPTVLPYTNIPEMDADTAHYTAVQSASAIVLRSAMIAHTSYLVGSIQGTCNSIHAHLKGNTLLMVAPKGCRVLLMLGWLERGWCQQKQWSECHWFNEVHIRRLSMLHKYILLNSLAGRVNPKHKIILTFGTTASRSIQWGHHYSIQVVCSICQIRTEDSTSLYIQSGPRHKYPVH